MFRRRAIVVATVCGAALLSTVAIGRAPGLVQQAGESQPEQEAQQHKEHLFGGSLWKKARYDVEGSFGIYKEGGKRYLELGRTFKTNGGPDLKLVLSPQTTSRVKAKTALDGGFVVGLLRSERGRQRYEIPTSLDLSTYRSLLIHCEQYAVLWASVELTPGRIAAYGADWTRKSNKVTGRFEIIEHEGRMTLRVSEEFKTRSGPDLKWVLSPHQTPEASGSNALRAGLNLGLLGDNKGAQSVRIPAETDLSKYRTLLVHCEQYSKLWAAADLTVVPE